MAIVVYRWYWNVIPISMSANGNCVPWNSLRWKYNQSLCLRKSRLCPY